MDYLRIPRENYDKLLDKDPKLIQMDIIDFIKYLRSKNLSYATISSYVSAINKFYNMILYDATTSIDGFEPEP
jgi:site-specific recombinase XerD